MRNLATALLLPLALAACSRPAAETVAPSNSHVAGTIVERLDEAPYSYLRVQTGPTAFAWIAVPVSTLDKGEKVEVVNGVAQQDVLLRMHGRRLDSVVFGTVKRE